MDNPRGVKALSWVQLHLRSASSSWHQAAIESSGARDCDDPEPVGRPWSTLRHQETIGSCTQSKTSKPPRLSSCAKPCWAAFSDRRGTCVPSDASVTHVWSHACGWCCFSGGIQERPLPSPACPGDVCGVMFYMRCSGSQGVIMSLPGTCKASQMSWFWGPPPS